MVKWLFIFIPILATAQVPKEQFTSEALELLDTTSLNTISPRHLWQVLGIPKDIIFALSEYRGSFGAIEHPDELFYIRGVDSLTANYLLDLLPLNRSKRSTKNQCITKSRLSQSGLKSTASLLHRSGFHRAALHITQENVTTLFSGFLSAHQGPLTFVIGNFSLHQGQGLLLGRDGFNSQTTNEYFRTGLKGQSGSSSMGILQGFGFDYQYRNMHFIIARDTEQLCYAWSTSSDHISYGIAGRGNKLTTFAKYSQGPLRLFSEVTQEAQKLGGNVFFRDVLYELVLQRKEAIAVLHYLSWRDRFGSWNVMVDEGRLRVNLQHKNYALTLNQHERTDAASTFRLRCRYPLGKTIYDLHWHHGTYGATLRRNFSLATFKTQLMTGMISSNGFPVWLSAPAAQGYIGALAVYEDFVGIALKVTKGPLSASTYFNAIRPEKWAVQISFYQNL